MLSTPSFDPFRRFRLRPTLVSLSLSPSSEDDTDDSSPERVRPHVFSRKSLGPRVTISDTQCDKLADTALLSIPFSQPPDVESQPERPSLKHRDLDRALQPPIKPNLIRRVTSKLHISIPSKPSQELPSRPSTRTVPINTDPRSRRIPPSPTLPNGFTSKEHREAALRERGLRPPRKDLSQQEREADERLGNVPSPSSSTDVNGLSEAERLKATWLAKNRSDLPSSAPLHLDVTASRPPSTPPSRSSSALSEIDVRCQSSEGKSPSVGRPSISSSISPLSASSALEVLHEDPSEQAPMTPAPVLQANVPIVVSSPIDYFGSSPILVESPISCTFSSLWPGPTVDSQSQSDHSHLQENGETCHARRSISCGSPRRMGSSLSRVASRSLSNIRRPIVSSLRLPSSTTLSSADPPPSPRIPISPTIHNLESIARETRDIADAESRRLSELAFLD